MATISTGADYPAYRLTQDRSLQARIECDFVASGSGSWYSRQCHNAALWVEAYRDSEGNLKAPVGGFGSHQTKRCDRHRKVDERTQKGREQRGWYARKQEYLPFDAGQVVADAVAKAAQEKASAAEEAVYEKVKASAQYLLAHVVGIESQTEVVRALRRMVNDVTRYEVNVKV